MKKMLFVAAIVVILSVAIATSTEAAPIQPPPQNVGILFLQEKGELMASVTIANFFGEVKINHLEFETQEDASKYCIAFSRHTQWAIFTAKSGYHWERDCKNGLSVPGYRLVQNDD